MNHFMVQDAVTDIYAAEYAFGIYSEKTAKVRKYWLHVVEPEKFEEMKYPDDVWETEEKHKDYLEMTKRLSAVPHMIGGV